MAQAPVTLEMIRNEMIGCLSEEQPIRPREDPRCTRQGGDHHAVPIGEDLIIKSRPNTLGAQGEKACAERRKGPVGFIGQHWLTDAVEDGMAFPISSFSQVIFVA